MGSGKRIRGKGIEGLGYREVIKKKKKTGGKGKLVGVRSRSTMVGVRGRTG